MILKVKKDINHFFIDLFSKDLIKWLINKKQFEKCKIIVFTL